MENYILLRDMINCKKGQIFKYCNGKFNYTDINNDLKYINEDLVIKNNDWFMKESEYQLLHPKTEQQQTTELSDYTKMLISDNEGLKKELVIFKNLNNEKIERYNKALEQFCKLQTGSINCIEYHFVTLEKAKDILKMAAGL